MLKRAKSIFRLRKKPTLRYSASGREVVPVAFIAQQKGSSTSEVKSVKDEPEAVPVPSPSTSNTPVATAIQESQTAIQSEVEVVPIPTDPAINVDTDPPSTSDVSLAPLPIDEGAIASANEVKATPNQELEEVNIGIGEGVSAAQVQDITIVAPHENAVEADIVSPDTVRTLQRYKKAIERIKMALELRRESWETFELSGFDSLPLGDEQDIANLQLQIDKVLDSRLSASKNRTKWRKSKDVIEQCFRVLAPFMKNVLSVGLNGVPVASTLGVSN